jgi:hypothetical protein
MTSQQLHHLVTVLTHLKPSILVTIVTKNEDLLWRQPTNSQHLNVKAQSWRISKWLVAIYGLVINYESASLTHCKHHTHKGDCLTFEGLPEKLATPQPSFPRQCILINRQIHDSVQSRPVMPLEGLLEKLQNLYATNADRSIHSFQPS